MLDLYIKFDDISIINIEKVDLVKIKQWIDCERSSIDGNSKCLENLNERYLESFFSECEFFSKIIKKNKIIGIIKGRVEFKSYNELWIWHYFVEEVEEDLFLEKKIIEELLNYFTEEFDIKNCYTRIIKGEQRALEFWKNNGFAVNRVVKNYYNIDGADKDMLVLSKISV